MPVLSNLFFWGSEPVLLEIALCLTAFAGKRFTGLMLNIGDKKACLFPFWFLLPLYPGLLEVFLANLRLFSKKKKKRRAHTIKPYPFCGLPVSKALEYQSRLIGMIHLWYHICELEYRLSAKYILPAFCSLLFHCSFKVKVPIAYQKGNISGLCEGLQLLADAHPDPSLLDLPRSLWWLWDVAGVHSLKQKSLVLAFHECVCYCWEQPQI